MQASEVRNAQAVLDLDARPIVTGGPAERRYADELQRVIDRRVANTNEDFRDEIQLELTRPAG